MVKQVLAPLSLLLAICACGPSRGPVDVEALVLDEDDPGRFRLDTVTLDTVADLHTGRGERFDVRGGFTVNAQTLSSRHAEDQPDFDDMVELGRSGASHDVAPRLAWDGRRWVAEDFDSLQYLTLFESFEEAWAYYDDVIGDASGATADKAIVGYYGSVSVSEELPIPVLTSDNAAYVALADSWLTFRIVLASDGIPFAMNPGVIAHEFSHRVFFHNVFGHEAFETWRAWMTSETPLTRSGNLIKGLDEGLADIFAAGHVRSASFMGPSFEGVYAREAEFRDLEGDFADIVTYDGLSASALGSDVAEKCGAAAGDLFADDSFNFYCVGTVVARSLYDGAGRDFDVLREDLLPIVNRALPDVGRAIQRQSELAGELVFDMDLFLEAVAARIPDLALRANVCAAFEQRFESLMTPARVPSCF